MAIETKEDTEKAKDEIIKTAFESAGKPAGPLDRAPELFTFMAVPSTLYFFWSNQPDLELLYALIVLFVVLSFVGGVITGGKPATPPPAEKAK